MLLPAVLLGLAIGSFLTVVIARLPEGRSLWGPRSACPSCGATIAWYDNIPLISFALLRARCRACGAAIPWTYPLVEGSTAGLFALAWIIFGPSAQFVAAIALAAALVAITAIDLRHQIIPDRITLPGVLAGLVANLTTQRVSWLESVLGVMVGGGIFWIIIELSVLATGREGMGGGDVKLGAMLGAFLGWKVVLLSIFLAVLAGGLLAAILLSLRITGRKDPIPFGPFLAGGGLVGLFWGPRLVAWYLSGFGG